MLYANPIYILSLKKIKLCCDIACYCCLSDFM